MTKYIFSQLPAKKKTSFLVGILNKYWIIDSPGGSGNPRGLGSPREPGSPKGPGVKDIGS